MNQLIISLFVGFLTTEVFNLGYYLRKYTTLQETSETIYKALTCLPCFTWWFSLIIGTVFFYDSEFQFVINAMASFVIAQFLDNR